MDKEDTRIGTVIDVFDGTGKLYFHHRDHNLAHKGTVAVTSLVATIVSTSAFEPFAFL